MFTSHNFMYLARSPGPNQFEAGVAGHGCKGDRSRNATGPILIPALPRSPCRTTRHASDDVAGPESGLRNSNLKRINQSSVRHTHAGKSSPKRLPHATADPRQRRGTVRYDRSQTTGVCWFLCPQVTHGYC